MIKLKILQAGMFFQAFASFVNGSLKLTDKPVNPIAATLIDVLEVNRQYDRIYLLYDKYVDSDFVSSVSKIITFKLYIPQVQENTMTLQDFYEKYPEWRENERELRKSLMKNVSSFEKNMFSKFRELVENGIEEHRLQKLEHCRSSCSHYHLRNILVILMTTFHDLYAVVKIYNAFECCSRFMRSILIVCFVTEQKTNINNDIETLLHDFKVIPVHELILKTVFLFFTESDNRKAKLVTYNSFINKLEFINKAEPNLQTYIERKLSNFYETHIKYDKLVYIENRHELELHKLLARRLNASIKEHERSFLFDPHMKPAKRYSTMKATYPHYIDSLAIMVPKGNIVAQHLTTLYIFTSYAWLFYIMAVISVYHIRRNLNRCSKTLYAATGFSKLQILEKYNTGKENITSNKWSNRLFIVCCISLSLIMNIAFTGLLTSYAVKPVYYPDINTLEQLFDTDMKIIMDYRHLRYICSEIFDPNLRELCCYERGQRFSNTSNCIAQLSSDEETKRFWLRVHFPGIETTIPQRPVINNVRFRYEYDRLNLKAVIQNIIANKNVSIVISRKYAMFLREQCRHEDGRHLLHVMEQCITMQFGQLKLRSELYFSVVNSIIQRAVQYGIIDKIELDLHLRHRLKKIARFDHLIVYSMKDLKFANYIVIAGLIAGIIVLLIENIYYRARKCSKIDLLQKN